MGFVPGTVYLCAGVLKNFCVVAMRPVGSSSLSCGGPRPRRRGLGSFKYGIFSKAKASVLMHPASPRPHCSENPEFEEWLHNNAQSGNGSMQGFSYSEKR